MPTRTGLRSFQHLAKTQHDSALTRIDDIEAAAQPDQNNNNGEQSHATTIQLWHSRPTILAGTALTTQQGRHLRVQFAQQLFQIGRATIVVLIAPLRVIQSHGSFLACLI